MLMLMGNQNENTVQQLCSVARSNYLVPAGHYQHHHRVAGGAALSIRLLQPPAQIRGVMHGRYNMVHHTGYQGGRAFVTSWLKASGYCKV